MPVHKVKGGYKWGEHGHVYKSRKGAERQAAAIYANGWREDSEALSRRAKALQMVLATKLARARYVRDLRRILGSLHHASMKIFGMKEDAKATPVKDWRKHMTRIEAGIQALRKPAGEAFDLMASSLNKSNKKVVVELLGLTPSDQGVEKRIAEAREENIQLVEKAGRTYAESVREVFSDPDNFGVRWEDLQDDLEERGEVMGSHAELIARDQTLKLNAALNEERQTNAGVTQYIWSTSKDERVRPDHAVLDGTTQSWDDPPLVGDDNLNPGEDFQCRCVAIPVIPGLEDQEDE